MAKPSRGCGIIPHHNASTNPPPPISVPLHQLAIPSTPDPKTTIAVIALPEESLENTWGRNIRLRLYCRPGWLERTERETKTLLEGRGDKAVSITFDEFIRTTSSLSRGSESAVRTRSRSSSQESNKRKLKKFLYRRRKTTPPPLTVSDLSQWIKVEGQWYVQKVEESDEELRRYRAWHQAKIKGLAVRVEDERHNYSETPPTRRYRFSPLLGFDKFGTAAGRKGKEKEKELPAGTICISTLLTAANLANMPSINSPTIGTRRRPSIANITSPSHMKNATKTIAKEDGKKALDEKVAHERNINQVVLGDTLFKTWYPSWYPNETLPEKEKGKGIVVETLYVCKWCFAYGKCVEDWVQHCKVCARASDGPPGSKIYSHGEKGILSIWEVDGDSEKVISISLIKRSFTWNGSC